MFSLKVIVLFLIFLFALLVLPQDFRKRKVGNVSVGSFAFLSFLFFLSYNLKLFLMKSYFTFLFSLMLILLVFFFSFLLYKKKIWGAADGKLFIAFSFLLLPFEETFFNFCFNLLGLYSLMLIFFSNVVTSSSTKKKVLFHLPYLEYYFTSALLLLIILPLKFFNLPLNVYPLLPFFFFLFLNIFLSLPVKKLYAYLGQKLSLSLSLLLTFFFCFHLLFLFFLIFLFFVKLFLEYHLELILKKDEKTKQTTPFTVYLFAAALLSLLFPENLLVSFLFLLKTLF
ncbi:MAG: hypothetical protein KC548_02855 [Nanoarchaeota archaeon]|nr:hypothetical protein [Nanoarchaeota archaeon]